VKFLLQRYDISGGAAIVMAAVMWKLRLSLDYASASEPSDCKATLLHGDWRSEK
jgi:hypothetical protein